MSNFSQRLKALRQSRGLTVKEAAKIVGVPMTTYRDWEYGRAVTGEPYVQIAKAFGVSLNSLMGFDEKVDISNTEFVDRIIGDLLILKSRIGR